MGGTPQYAYRDGQRLAPAVAYDLDRMAAAFLADTGESLHVAERGGLRWRSEQLYLYTGWIRRLPGFNMAAHPDDPKAYHVETNPNGARAVDLYDSGAVGGVGTGTGPRHQWMLANAHRFNFENEGLSFANPEAWHKRWTGADPWKVPTGAPANYESEEDPMPKHEHKARTTAKVPQSLGKKGTWYALEVSGTDARPEHRVAATGPGQTETGDLVVTVTFGRGGTPGQELAQLRIQHQQKVGGKWITREETEPLDVIATAGGTTVQYACPYALGPDYRTRVLAAGLVDDVTIAKVAYRKNYWRG